MDRIIYTAANGLNRVVDAQSVISNNMANISTTGFREQLSAYRAVPVTAEGGNPAATTRVLTSTVSMPGLFNEGPTIETGNPLDLRIQGQGWFVVRDTNGREAYTRNGHFVLNNQGVLVDAQGRQVLAANGGPIDLADAAQISFDEKGGVNTVARGARPRDIQRTAQLKLVNPPLNQLVRGDDGLFRVVNAQGNEVIQPHDESVRTLSKALEGSNVSAADAMVKLIQNGRMFDMNSKIIEHVSANEQSANSILSASN